MPADEAEPTRSQRVLQPAVLLLDLLLERPGVLLDAVGEAIVRHPEVRKVAFTGSVGVGRAIGRIAADRIIPLTLELGGKSANIVFEDADLDRAAADAVRGFTVNAGQVCSAGTRLLVQRSIYAGFLERVAAIVETVVPGDNLGPMITPA